MGAKVIVVGAGAAGIMAAWRAATLGAEVTLLEKTPRIGTKILISGGGKCNITHDGEIEDVLKGFRPNEARFLRPACYRFTNRQIIEMLTDRGLRVYTRPDGRIFPVDATAKDVVAILRSYLDDAKVDVRLQCPVTDFVIDDVRVTGVRTSRSELSCDSLILSTGGSSYPNSGTTGDGWPWVRALGHNTLPILAALAPMDVALPFDSPSGVALRDCIVKARENGKEISRWRGDMLFTHHGISGPTALAISREVAEAAGEVTIEVDIVPNATFETLTEELLQQAKESPRRTLATFVGKFVADSLVDLIFDSAGVSPSTMGAHLERTERNRLIETLKGWNLGEVKHVPIDKGEVVAGGVSLDEVDSHTMRSSRAPNLFLCGEILDIAGHVGGYNLQAAFSTGYVAGESAAKA